MARNYNQFNPESAPACERIEMTVVAPSTDDYTFYEWYKQRSLLSGTLTYELPVSMNHTYSENRVIEFKDALCFGFSESYDIDTHHRRLLKLLLVPTNVILNNVSFQKL
jgi:hypothetical protein